MREYVAIAVKHMKKTREIVLMKKRAMPVITQTTTCARTMETNARKPVKSASNCA